MNQNHYPMFVCVNCPGNIHVRIEDDCQLANFFNCPELRKEMERNAVIRHFFPKISELEIQELCIRLSIERGSKESINSVYEKVKDYYFKVCDERKRQEEQAAMIRATFEETGEFKVSKEDAKLKVKRKHKHGTGKVEEAYKIFANIRPNKGEKRKEPEPQAIVSRREFKNWLGGNHVPKEFPGINNLFKFVEWARNWESEGKRSRTVNGMSDEEMYRKREK